MIYRRSVYTLTSDGIRAFALFLFLSYSVLRTMSSYVGLDINLVGYFVVTIMYGLFFISLLYEKPPGFKQALILLISIILMIFLSTVLFPQNGDIFSRAFGLQHGPIIILFVCSISNEKRIEKCIIAHALLSVIQMGFGLLTYVKNGGYWLSTFEGHTKYSNYNMSVGYYATFAALMFIQYYFKDKKKYKLIISVALMAISIIFGARGCLLCYIVFAILSIKQVIFTKKQLLLVIFSILLALGIYIIGINSILSYFVQLLKNFGLESRTLNQFLIGSGSSISTSGRDELWEILIRKIGEKPIFGYGILGEQHIFEEIYGNIFYAHNIILEMLVSFGIPLGTVILLLLTINSFKAKIILNNTVLGIGYTALLSYNVGNLMVSNTYWYSTNFWIMIALIIIAFTRKEMLTQEIDSEKTLAY